VHPALILTLILLVSPLLIVLAHMIVARAKIIASRQIGCIFAFTVALLPVMFPVGVALACGMPRTQVVSGIIYSLVVYACISYSYFHVFNMSETARRIRILHEIYKAGSLRAKDILSLYEASDIIEARLGRLTLINQLTLDRGVYRVRGKLLYYAGIVVRVWRRLLGFEPIDRQAGRRGSPAE
jgi:hypothetical protein